MATRAILVNFHKYTPFGPEFYEPLLDFFLASMKRYEDEYDMLYLLDSNWEIDPAKLEGLKARIIHTNPHVRYYDCFKATLPLVQEDLVLFLDDDTVVYKPGKIGATFAAMDNPVKQWDLVSIYDTIGDYKTDKLRGKNKFCPYWFATRKDTLMKYLDVDWAPDMPYCETLGHLTESMLDEGINPFEWEEDKSNILFDGTQEGEKGKDLGYYHIRAGSTVAYLLSTKKYGELKTYLDYLHNQPEGELLRHCAWYQYMGGDPWEIVSDLGNGERISKADWELYFKDFKKYHNLP